MAGTSSRRRVIIGIDEVGRGPIAGPVAVCALALFSPLPKGWEAVRDSKRLSRLSRERWYRDIRAAKKGGMLSYAVAHVSQREIDRRGISAAIRTALSRALSSLKVSPRCAEVLLDGGLSAPRRFLLQKTIVRGDEKEPAIALASIVAKVRRDLLMRRLARKFPGYGFEAHAGYGTAAHYDAIRRLGLSPAHRRTFLSSIRSGKG